MVLGPDIMSGCECKSQGNYEIMCYLISKMVSCSASLETDEGVIVNWQAQQWLLHVLYIVLRYKHFGNKLKQTNIKIELTRRFDRIARDILNNCKCKIVFPAFRLGSNSTT